MGIFRSEIMLHKHIRIPKEIASEVMNELGKLEDAVEFIDLNKDDLEAKKNYGEMIKKCDEMEKKIANFEKICETYNLKFVKYLNYQSFIRDLNSDETMRHRKFGLTYFDLIESEIFEDEKKILELIESHNQVNDNYDTLIEKKAVYDKVNELMNSGAEFSENNIKHMNFNIESLDEEIGYRSDLNFMAGVIKAEDELRMKRMIFRISKGRAIPTFFNLLPENRIIKTKVQKRIFTIFFQGGIESVLLAKLLKVCDIFGASRFNIPKKEEIRKQISELQQELFQKNSFLKQANKSIEDFLKNKIGNAIGNDVQPSIYELYRLYFKKERMVFTNLNKCLVRGNFIDGEIWVPEEKLQVVSDNLSNLGKNSINAFLSDTDGTDATPPTYIKTNDLTSSFQLIVDTYGVPRYREANPALFAIVTFPFLFGVMFGDIGHGGLLLLFGLFLVFKHDDLKRDNSPLVPALKARYLFLFMGICAFYCGWMYNDFLSVPLGILGTCYKTVGDHNIAKKDPNCTYPFGIDPKWYVASNELAFMNSLKMKLSVVIGVIHMSCGIVLKGMNAIYFKSAVDFVFEFVPQLIFMTFLFGYMVIMIFIKWATDWGDQKWQAPSIIGQLMAIVLNFGSVGPTEETKLPLFDRSNYHYQESIHHFILIVCVICVPIMLLPKPIIQYLRSNKKQEIHRASFNKFIDENEGEVNAEPKKHEANHHDSHSFGEIFVHQAIETIEFVLGAVSNTASYLRLWALSLAHAQLAKVFFEKSLLSPIQEGDIVWIVIGFFIFANVTFFVLMLMDLLECFLHTLRLHWVEFQGKFFKADGYRFTPYCFRYIVEPSD